MSRRWTILRPIISAKHISFLQNSECKGDAEKEGSMYNENHEVARGNGTEETNDIKEENRQLKNNFERLNTLYQEFLEEGDKVKAEMTAKLHDVTEKYRVTLKENEELKEKVEILFKLGRSYIDKA